MEQGSAFFEYFFHTCLRSEILNADIANYSCFRVVLISLLHFIGEVFNYYPLKRPLLLRALCLDKAFSLERALSLEKAFEKAQKGL